MAVGLGARKNNMDLRFFVAPPTGVDVNLSGGQSAGAILKPFPSASGKGGGGAGNNVHLWVWGITFAAIVYLLGVHWTLGTVRSLAD